MQGHCDEGGQAALHIAGEGRQGREAIPLRDRFIQMQNKYVLAAFAAAIPARIDECVAKGVSVSWNTEAHRAAIAEAIVGYADEVAKAGERITPEGILGILADASNESAFAQFLSRSADYKAKGYFQSSGKGPAKAVPALYEMLGIK